ncbi:caspase family protein [Paucibacter sp. AS339]|uniref:caspase family protein n=1 Tax=Paucibacter hankyongi TaxID=3133434 RepID=UPI0030B58CC5
MNGLIQRLAAACALVGILISPTRAAEPERFALLVGVTDYLQPKDYTVTALKGPGNDVAAMKALLTRHYKFKDDGHIKVLTGAAATRAGIEDAFKSHLVGNAKKSPGAVVVFYFSGHGSKTADVNADEGDGIDETLVAYDSRGPNGKDIIDDEVDGWLNQLRQHTPNITVIFDSCHSGSAARGLETARNLPPNPNMPQPPASRGLEGNPTPHLLRKDTYVGISAAMAHEYSYESQIAEAGGKVHGYLTWFLTQTLDRRPQLTWRQAMNEIQRGVGSVTLVQHPLVEGSIDRVAFGLPGETGTPYVRLSSQDGNGGIQVAAGVAQGVAKGGTLAIYSPDTRRLVGDGGKIATAQVTEVGIGLSRAVIIDGQKKGLPADAKVTIVTPFYGTDPMLILLDKMPDQQADAKDMALLQSLRTAFAEGAALKAVPAGENWMAAVQKGCLAGERLHVADAPTGCTPVYFIGGRQAQDAIVAKYVPIGSVDAADRLVQAFSQLAKVSALRALSNQNSALRLSLEMMQVDVSETAAGELVLGAIRPVSRPTKPLSVRVGDRFTFKLTNDSNKDVYAALVVLNASGTVERLSEAPNGELVKAGKSMTFNAPILAGLPLGLDTYKVIATTNSNVDFSVLESPDRARAVWSPLERFLASASSTGSRDGSTAKGVPLSEWVTVQENVQVLPATQGIGK